MLRNQDGPTSHIQSQGLMDEIKKVQTAMDNKLWKSDSETRRDIGQVAR